MNDELKIRLNDVTEETEPSPELVPEDDSPHIVPPPVPAIPPINDTGTIFIRYLTHPPEITIRPRNLQVRANGIAAFYCAAKGDPMPNIQWRKNGKRVSSMQSRYQVFSMDATAGPRAIGAVLRIEPVRAQRDDATYECVAENGVGDAVSAVATLTVFEGLFLLRLNGTTPGRIKHALR
ncbi:unnamed protein product [Diatraea saccharalis]|uniref:Ig-like domain-containing protein n=1 Tax=Diatraea saccharalis TaxID=40085 RepID=A0A9N9RC12_9NEOP|nr:unnamed protein product [Diatraea saccharalis]